MTTPEPTLPGPIDDARRDAAVSEARHLFLSHGQDGPAYWAPTVLGLHARMLAAEARVGELEQDVADHSKCYDDMEEAFRGMCKMKDSAQAALAEMRESWIAARHVVFAAREVCSAWPADLDFGKPGTSIGKLRDVVTAYDQRNHEDSIGTPSSGIGWRRITGPRSPEARAQGEG